MTDIRETIRYNADGELDRILAGSKLRRPTENRDPRDRRRKLRDPGGEWDWFYELDQAERDYIRRHHMVHVSGVVGHGGIGPDDVATNLDMTTDAAMQVWLTAMRLTRTRASDPFADDYDQADDASSLPPVLGRHEVAAAMGVKVGTVFAWEQREQLKFPARDLTVNNLPAWYRETIEEWALFSGRECSAQL